MIWLLLLPFIFPPLVKGSTVLIDTFKDKCAGYDDVSYFQFKDIKFLLINHTTYISTRVVVLKDIDHDLKFEIFPTKCKSKDALDTCETYRSYKIKNLCRLLNSANTPWAPFLTHFEPRVRCPVKKGVYVQTNGTLDASSLPNWTKSYWKVMTVIKDQVTDEFALCHYMEFQII